MIVKFQQNKTTMGRTSKYKKIKAFDPYSKKNGGKISLDTVGIWGLGDNGAKPKKRSRTAERLRNEKLNRKLKRQKSVNPKAGAAVASSSNNGRDAFNRPPSDDEDDFDLTDMEGSLKRQKTVAVEILEDADNHKNSTLLHSVKAGATTSEPLSSSSNGHHGVISKDEIKEATKLLKLDKDKSAAKHEGRRENESKNAFDRRAKLETRQIIKQENLKELNPEKRRRKKEFLKQKKQKKRKGGQRSQLEDNNDDDADDAGYHAIDKIAFGEQAERPPVFKVLPRGASNKNSNAGSKKSARDKKVIQTKEEIEAEQENLERMRRKVQEQYNLIKAKRKRAGEFHL